MNLYQVGPGWWPMLDDLLSEARKVAPDVTHEEKEKYGLCDLFLWSKSQQDDLYDISVKAEEQSVHICEFCGRPGRLRTDRPWFQTLCDGCDALKPLERRKVAEETAERYYRGSHLRTGSPADRTQYTTVRLKDYLSNERGKTH